MAALLRGTYTERIAYDTALLSQNQFWYQTTGGGDSLGSAPTGYYRWNNSAWESADSVAAALVPQLVAAGTETTIAATSPIYANCLLDIAGQSINTETLTAIVYSSVQYDTDAMTALATSTGVLTIQTAGMYVMASRCAWEGNATGTRQIRIVTSKDVENGNQPYDIRASAGAGFTIQTIFGVTRLEVGDTVFVDVYQSSGSTLICFHTYLSICLIVRL